MGWTHLDTIAVWHPRPARHERGEGWGEGRFSLVNNWPPLPDPLLLGGGEGVASNSEHNSVKIHPNGTVGFPPNFFRVFRVFRG